MHISFDIDGAKEVVTTNETGILVEPRSAPQLAAALNRLVDDPVLRHQFGQTGRALLTDRFRHQTMTRLIREVYTSVLQSH